MSDFCPGGCGCSMLVKVAVKCPGDKQNRDFCSVRCGAAKILAERFGRPPLRTRTAYQRQLANSNLALMDLKPGAVHDARALFESVRRKRGLS